MRWAVLIVAMLAIASSWASSGASAGASSGASPALAARHLPIIIGHRGASADRPEHTIESYRTAVAQGADFIEPDLVSTSDGALVARHENEIGSTTDVAAHPEFASRKATKSIDGETITGWFTEDFTLAELRTLRARERLPQLRTANSAYDGKFAVPTLQEIIDLVHAEETRLGKRIGLYPETKHPGYFRSIGLPLEPGLLATLKRNGYSKRTDPVFIQSFETGNLQALRRATDLRLIQLVGEAAPADRPDLPYDAMMAPAGLRAIARYADGIGPGKDRIIPRRADGTLAAPTGLVAQAHTAGLQVHPYTFRPENYFLPAEFRIGSDPGGRGNAAGEIRAFMATGIDGLFSDSPEAAVAARVKP
jgi:glycerophosphoryl diester phosphodiesterase